LALVRLAGTTTRGGLRAKAEAIAQAVAGALKVGNRIISVASRGRPAFITGHIAQGQ
jgi:hypothetical protein